MKFIRKWSYSCARALTKQLADSHEKRSIYYYGFQIVIGAIVKFIILVLAAATLGVFYETGAMLLFFAGLRTFAGGYHMDTYGGCMATTLGILLGGGIAIKYLSGLFSTETLIAFSIVVFIIGIYATVRWAPADNPKKRMTNKSKKIKLKIVSSIYMVLWAAAAIALSIDNSNMLVMAGCLGILLGVFIITPLGYSALDRLDGKKEPSWSTVN